MILLFDVDGVLIENQAYRAALRQTVAYFARRLGLNEVRLTDADIEVFESQSITVEWDSGAICAAALLVERLKATPGVSLPPDLGGAFDQLAAQPVHLPQPDFGALARRVGAATPPGGLPSRAALELFRAETPEATPILTHLLGDCYSIDRAPAMQIFQNYALGHRLYAEYYGLPAQVEGEPLLEKLDKSYLKAEMRDRLLARRTAGAAFPALYTARPSLAPIESGRTPRGYTPEAEIARKIAGLDPAPVMGFGKVDWLARRTGYIGADLVKPSPVQSIAAIAAARTGLETESLKAALAAVRGDHLRYPLTACKGETVHIFEDSASSLRAVTRAVELLNRHGLNLRLVRHGVGPRGSPKRDTLAQAADVLHEDVNEGLAQVLSM
ncbi:MAG: hypothetical protein ACRDH2_12670, partial [Anaerolineales bacterium]